MSQNESVLAGAITSKDISMSRDVVDRCTNFPPLTHSVLEEHTPRGELPTTDEGWAKLRAEEESRRDRILKQLEESEKYPTAPTKTKKGFFVFRSGGTSPSVVHPDRDSALQEAHRLVTKVPTSKFYVCQITDELEAKVNIEVKTWVK